MTTSQHHIPDVNPRHIPFMSTDELEELLDRLGNMDITLVTPADEDLADRIENELSMRELEASLPAHDDIDYGPAYDSPSLEDRGIYLGSYAS